ncbi:tetratricopeptide repeat protein, partial [Pseudomonas aeruginosa]|nr:tetratricopeptide repeat protein [Pseudomonas aeruginosa]
AAELLDWLAAQGSEDAPRNPEKEVQWLLQALAERPDDTDLREVAASALQACSADDEAIDLLWEYVERHTDEEQQLAYYLLNALLARGE